jgi:hypothetical protein
MRSFMLGAAAAAFISLSAGSALAQESVLEQVNSLCVATHADPQKVLAAAANEGWQAVKPTDSTTNTFVKKVEGRTYALLVGRKVGPFPGLPTLQLDLCAVSVSPAGDDIRPLARALVRSDEPPIVDDDGSWQWIYTERDGVRHFLTDKKEESITAAILRDGVLKQLAAGTDPQKTTVVYMEMRKGGS